jgi:hypothetical protein
MSFGRAFLILPGERGVVARGVVDGMTLNHPSTEVLPRVSFSRTSPFPPAFPDTSVSEMHRSLSNDRVATFPVN